MTEKKIKNIYKYKYIWNIFFYLFFYFIYLFIYFFIIIIFRYAIAYLRTGSYAPAVSENKKMANKICMKKLFLLMKKHSIDNFLHTFKCVPALSNITYVQFLLKLLLIWLSIKTWRYVMSQIDYNHAVRRDGMLISCQSNQVKCLWTSGLIVVPAPNARKNRLIIIATKCKSWQKEDQEFQYFDV